MAQWVGAALLLYKARVSFPTTLTEHNSQCDPKLLTATGTRTLLFYKLKIYINIKYIYKMYLYKYKTIIYKL